MNLRFSSEALKAEALRLGFFGCGIARARAVDDETAFHYRQWIAQGGHADMQYLENNLEKRLDPTLLLEGARSIIVVAMNYAPARSMPANEYQIAAYALGKDYHDVMKARLRQLHSQFSMLCTPLDSQECSPKPESMQTQTIDSEESKICVDTVPILERYWAQKAGLGFIGHNHQLIIPHAGSMFFLGEIVTTAESDHYDTPMENHCGLCRRCMEACPTGALTIGKQNGLLFDSRKCLSYQTIENHGNIAEELKEKLGNVIYGCDRCQQVCPWNRFAQPTNIPELHATDELLAMRRKDWQQLSLEDYRRLFRGSAVKRAKYEGLMRNISTIRATENEKK